jgi:hypothetical protein
MSDQTHHVCGNSYSLSGIALMVMVTPTNDFPKVCDEPLLPAGQDAAMSTTVLRPEVAGKRPNRDRGPRVAPLLGPAFVAAIAYVDPGNVATNLTARATCGYLLV